MNPYEKPNRANPETPKEEEVLKPFRQVEIFIDEKARAEFLKLLQANIGNIAIADMQHGTIKAVGSVALSMRGDVIILNAVTWKTPE